MASKAVKMIEIGGANLYRLLRLAPKGADMRGCYFMFVCYLDDSDNTTGPVLNLAGYYSTVEQWLLFEHRANKLLADWNVSTLRGKDFRNDHGSFKHWSRKDKHFFYRESVLNRSSICYRRHKQLFSKEKSNCCEEN